MPEKTGKAIGKCEPNNASTFGLLSDDTAHQLETALECVMTSVSARTPSSLSVSEDLCEAV